MGEALGFPDKVRAAAGRAEGLGVSLKVWSLNQAPIEEVNLNLCF